MVDDKPLFVDDSSTTVTLPDGRQLGYAQYGSKTGPTIICLHGAPGSRIDFARSNTAAKAVGARILAVDRPGIGLSSPHVKGTLLTFAKDVQDLTESLGLNRYAILGGSAGGPYALTCAHALPPTKLIAVAIICGIAGPTMTYPGQSWLTWASYKSAPYLPAIFFRWFWSQEPGSRTHLATEEHLKLLRSCVAKSQPHEREIGRFDTNESVNLWLATSREAFKHGLDGIVSDTLRLLSDWGFQIEDIRKELPVVLWYGSYDGLAPPALGEDIAKRIGKNAHLTIKDETHGSMFANQAEAYLKELVGYFEEDAEPVTG